MSMWRDPFKLDESNMIPGTPIIKTEKKKNEHPIRTALWNFFFGLFVIGWCLVGLLWFLRYVIDNPSVLP